MEKVVIVSARACSVVRIKQGVVEVHGWEKRDLIARTCSIRLHLASLPLNSLVWTPSCMRAFVIGCSQLFKFIINLIALFWTWWYRFSQILVCYYWDAVIVLCINLISYLAYPGACGFDISKLGFTQCILQDAENLFQPYTGYCLTRNKF